MTNPTMMVCRNRRVAKIVSETLPVDVMVPGDPLLGHRWEIIIVPEGIAQSTGSEALDAATADWLVHLNLKLKLGGQLIFI